MLKILIAVLLTVIVFSGALYIGIVAMVGDTVTMINSDVLPFVPIEFRVGLLLLILGLVVATGKSFIK